MVFSPAFQGSEAAEGVSGEKCLFLRKICHHCLRPVDHGGHFENKRTMPQVKGIVLINYQYVICDSVISCHHRYGLRIGDYCHIRPVFPGERNQGGMVRLHVVYDEIIHRFSSGCPLYFLNELVTECCCGCVNECCLFIGYHIGVVCDSFRQSPLIFKEKIPEVISPNVFYEFRFHFVLGFIPFCKYNHFQPRNLKKIPCPYNDHSEYQCCRQEKTCIEAFESSYGIPCKISS